MKRFRNRAKIIMVIFSVLLAFMISLPAFAAEQKKVVDDENILSDEQEAKLEEKLDELSQRTGHDIVVITVKDFSGSYNGNLVDHADAVFKEKGYGQGDSRSGILLLVSDNMHEYAMSVNGDAREVFSEGDLESLENAFFDYLHEEQYYEAFDAFADRCDYIIKYDKRLSPIWIVISLVVGAVVAFIVVNSMTRKHKSVQSERRANNYMLHDTFRLDRSRDVYLYSTITRVIKPRNNSPSGRGGSSGGSYGRSGRF